MKQIMKHCETCEGLGLVKIDSLGEIHSVEVEKVWNEDAESYLKVTECICPDCLGLGEIDITEDVEDDIEYFKRKEMQSEN